MEKLITFNRCGVRERHNEKYLQKHPKYKNVSIYKNTKTLLNYFRARFQYKYKTYIKDFNTDLEAAKWVDLKMIELGLSPVNILKKK